MTALERVLDALREAGRPVARCGDGWRSSCPAHDGQNRTALSISQGRDGVLVYCHADITCTPEAITSALGLTVRDLFDRPDGEDGQTGSARGLGEIVATYDYVDERGELLYQVCRFAPKAFRQRRPDGRGGWTWRIKGVRQVLYRLPEVLAAVREGQTIYVVEGEKDVHAVEGAGAVGTCNSGGAGKWRDEFADTLTGAHVVIVADSDAPGLAHARQVRDSLNGRAASIQVVRAAHGKDAADHLAAGYTLDDFAPLDEDDLADPDEADQDAPHLAPIPDYPVDAMPGPLGELVRAGASGGLPAAFTGAGGLAVLAYVAADCRIQVGGTWVEPPALWVAVIGAAGSAKSPAWDYAWQPVYAHERTLADGWKADLDAWSEMVRAAKKDKNAPDPGPKPANPGRYMSDATIEVVLRRLQSGPKILAVDELRTFLGSIGRYGGRGASVERDRGIYLSAWDGRQPIVYERVTDDTTVVVDEPVLSITGTLQDSAVSLLGDVESGFRARWLPHFAHKPAGPPRIAPEPTEWNRAVEALLRSRPTGTLHLEGDAREVWEAARIRWDAEASDASPGVASALRKADRQALRVALVLAVSLDVLRGTRSAPVPVDAMRGAVSIVDFALDCWRALDEDEALALTREEERLAPAVRKLAAWLEARPDGKAAKRDIAAARVGGARTAAVVDKLIAEYERVYPGSVRQERIGKRGPAPTVVYAPRRGTQRNQNGQRDRMQTADVSSLRSVLPSPPTEETAGSASGHSRETPENSVSSIGVSSNSVSSNGASVLTERNECAVPDCTRTPRRSCRTCADHMDQEPRFARAGGAL